MSLSVQSCGRAEGHHECPVPRSVTDTPEAPSLHEAVGTVSQPDWLHTSDVADRGSLNLFRPQFSHTKGEGPKLEVAFEGLKWNLVYKALAEANVWRSGQSHLDQRKKVGTAPPSARLSYGLKWPTHTCLPASHLPPTHR